MPTSVGPNTKGEENLVFAYDTGNFPHGWGVTQLIPNSEFTSPTPRFTAGSAFTNANYLGALYTGSMTGNSFIFSGGDSANYSVSQPEIWGWDRGSIGSTSGNWMFINILPSSADATRDFIVDCKWRFVYVSATGNGSLNPTFQIGRAYTQLYTKNFSNAGSSYDWQYAKFKINGADGNQNTSNVFTIGLTSADAAVEIDYMRVYEINKTSGLLDLTGNSTIDLTNVSFDSNAQMEFDGTDDRMNIGLYHLSGSSHTEEVVVYRASTGSTHGILSDLQYGFFGLYINSNDNAVYRTMQQNPGQTPEYLANIRYGTSTLGIGYHHIVGVFSMTEGFKLYVKGVLESSSSQILPYNLAGNRGITDIGVYKDNAPTAYNYPFDGRIEIIKCYNRALTASEIKSNFNAIKGRFNIL